MILKVRQSQGDKVSEAVAALDLCHNVTPVYEVVEGVWRAERGSILQAEADQGRAGQVI